MECVDESDEVTSVTEESETDNIATVRVQTYSTRQLRATCRLLHTFCKSKLGMECS